ncbi:Ran-binding protein 10 Short=RanBP10 [Rhizoctonia solani AG-1 IB]|uniref:Ran-binding protein 10 Short=RanBP10 n=1 Tax=Thanatephorus cucumeris (strain AG1-IB / isolate 7/3/14) TaxID=1108050 RepID=M5BJC5_THACB|nr:Ran-binding protein 10 Short=RanBP10 [Rhizoctonia solani AG-1 IB]
MGADAIAESDGRAATLGNAITSTCASQPSGVDSNATEVSSPEPTTRSSSASLSIVSDSDIDPREARGTPTPEPRNESSDVIRVPTRWNASDKHHALVLSPDGREVRYPSPTHSTDKEAAAIRANHPMPAACGVYYFEVQIIEKGTQGHIGIGFSSRQVGLNRLPGWEPMSWGYHGDDGNSFAGQSDGTPYGPVFGTGDIIGCGVDFTEGTAFYTKNGEFLKKAFRNIKGDLYPSVGLRTPKERVLANFGQDPFRFDVATYVMQRRDRVWREIQRTPLDEVQNPKRIVRAPPEKATIDAAEREADALRRPFKALVLAYLTHHGYSGTARALRASIAAGGGAGEDTPMDEERQVESALVLDEDDTAARQRIVRAVTMGDIDSALAEIENRYPAFVTADRDDGTDDEDGMDEDGGGNGGTAAMGMVMFRLRCRKLVEMLLAAEGDELGEAEPGTPTKSSLALKGKGKGKGRAGSEADADGDVHMISTSPLVLNPTITSTPGSLAAALEYGQFLHQKYGHDTRPHVQTELRAASGLVAYSDPRTATGHARELVSPGARAKLADEVNRVVLSSQGRPEHTALESVYRQTVVVTEVLAREGVGQAAFADVEREFLGGDDKLLEL